MNPWHVYLNPVWPREASPFGISVEKIRERARRNPPDSSQFGRRVTDFSSWVYSLYEPAIRPEALQRGLEVEREILEQETRHYAPLSTRELRQIAYVDAPDEWVVDYRDTLDGNAEVLEVSRLKVRGDSLKGRPDLVFRNTSSGRIIIVERKASLSPIPSDGWPNLRAQLWAYGNCDRFFSAPRITLVGEAWFRDWDGRVRRSGSVVWELAELEEEGRELFRLYGGLVDARLPHNAL